jgi:hypothetical protein
MERDRASASPPSRPRPTSAASVRLLGRLLTNAGLLAEGDLQAALSRQAQTKERLGETLVGMGLLSEDELVIALSLQHSLTSVDEVVEVAAGIRSRLGELLVESGRIAEAQLEDALALQATSGRRLGEILVQRGALSTPELEAVLAFQQRQDRPNRGGPLQLGELLVTTGRVSRDQLDAALVQQAGSGRRLGEVLVDLGDVDAGTVTWALRLQRAFSRAALAALLAMAALGPGSADGAQPGRSTSAQLQVSVTVLARTLSAPIDQQAALLITADDIARGYVDAPHATRLEIRTNATDGYLLFRGIHVSGAGEVVSIGSGNGWVHMPFTGSRVTLDLSYRFLLRTGISPGEYPWPVDVQARTL